MSKQELAHRNLGAELVEKVVVDGDLSKLTSEERLNYYKSVCDSVGLNPLTKPFEYIKLNGKLRLYALKGATDQLRAVHGISITDVRQEFVDDLIIVTAHARDRDGQEDTDVGAVPLGNLKGEGKANAIMKAITKAKRRVTLSMVGLGMLDETEVSTIPNAEPIPVEIAHEEIDEPAGLTDEQVDKTIRYLADHGVRDPAKFASLMLDRDVELIGDLTPEEARIVMKEAKAAKDQELADAKAKEAA